MSFTALLFSLLLLLLLQDYINLYIRYARFTLNFWENFQVLSGESDGKRQMWKKMDVENSGHTGPV